MSGLLPHENDPDGPSGWHPHNRISGHFSSEFHDPVTPHRTLELTKENLIPDNYSRIAIEQISLYNRYTSLCGTRNPDEITKLTWLCRLCLIDNDIATASILATHLDTILPGKGNLAPLEVVTSYYTVAIVFQKEEKHIDASRALRELIDASDFSGPIERGLAAEAMDLLALYYMKTELFERARYYLLWARSLAVENPELLSELVDEVCEKLSNLPNP